MVLADSRPGEREFDRGHFEDLIDRVLEAGDLDLARKIQDHCGASTLLGLAPSTLRARMRKLGIKRTTPL